MSEVKRAWWAKAVMVGGVIGIVCLALGAFGYRLNILGVMPGLLMTAAATVLGVLCVVVGLIGLIVVLAKGRTAERSSLVIGVVLGALILGMMGPYFLTSVPPIHNITSDMVDPPQFDKIVALRGDNSNPHTYDAEVLAPQQKAGYPDLSSLRLDAAPQAVLRQAADVMESLGIEVVNIDEAKGIVEGTATTRWFAFKDDVVVRVRADGAGSLVDARSVSRVGQSDLGVNAKRINAIFAGLRG